MTWFVSSMQKKDGSENWKRTDECINYRGFHDQNVYVHEREAPVVSDASSSLFRNRILIFRLLQWLKSDVI